MEGLLVLGLLIGAFVPFALLALRFGTDSRESFAQRRAIVR